MIRISKYGQVIVSDEGVVVEYFEFECPELYTLVDCHKVAVKWALTKLEQDHA